MQGSALPVLQVLLGEASGCWWLYLHIHCAALLWNAHTANPSPKASNKTSSKGQIQTKQKQEVPYGKRKKERGGKKKKVWSDQQIQLQKVLFPCPLKKLSKLFTLKWNFKETGCLPSLHGSSDSFLLHFSLLHWLFPGQGTQLTELNFIPLQALPEQLKWPVGKNGKSKQCFLTTSSVQTQ